MTNQHSHAGSAGSTDPFTASSEAVFVSAVMGTGDDAHRLIRAHGMELIAYTRDNEPLAPAFDVARRLGFKRARDVNELIERTWPEAQRPMHRRTVRQWIAGKGSERRDEIDEYLLTEAQLLKLCARARTENAEAILDDMIRVYILARRGLLPGQADPGLVRRIALGVAADAINPLVDRLNLALDRLRVVETAQVPRAETVFCGPQEGARLRARIRRIAHLQVQHLRPAVSLPAEERREGQRVWRNALKVEIGDVSQAVQDACGYDTRQRGAAWDFLPIGERFTKAWETLHHLEARAEAAADKRRSRETGEAQTVILFEKKGAR